MGGQILPPPGVVRPLVRRAVALLGGNMDELAVLRAACLAGPMHDARVELCWLEAGNPPSRQLLRELAQDSGLGDVSPGGLADLLDSGRVGTVMLAPTLWRRLATSPWPRFQRTAAYVRPQ